MSTPEPNPDDEWTKIWDARLEALASVLGKPEDTVYHAVIPFGLGGSADVVSFPNYLSGNTYVTSELTGVDIGQQPNSLGHYELMICTREPMATAADFVSRLARHTCDAVIEAGHTMDIGEFFKDSTLRAMLFTHPGEQPVVFNFNGQLYNLLLCVGITSEELAYARSRGSNQLLQVLKEHDVFPYTTPNRPPVPLPPGGFSFRRLFGG